MVTCLSQQASQARQVLQPHKPPARCLGCYRHMRLKSCSEISASFLQLQQCCSIVAHYSLCHTVADTVSTYRTSNRNSDIAITGMNAGTFSGLMQTAITTPTELLKIRLQLQTQLPGHPGYVGPVRLLKQVIMREGISGMPHYLTICTCSLMTCFRDAQSS